jgi:hypothetical protein
MVTCRRESTMRRTIILNFLIWATLALPPFLAALTMPARAYAVLFHPGQRLDSAVSQAAARGWRIVRVGMASPIPLLILVPGPQARPAGIFAAPLAVLPGCAPARGKV